jgi:hypothetical protein
MHHRRVTMLYDESKAAVPVAMKTVVNQPELIQDRVHMT